MDAAGVADSGIAFGTILPGGPDFQEGVWSTTSQTVARVVEVEILIDGDQLQWLMDGLVLTTVTASKEATGGVGIGINDPFPGFNNGSGLGTGTGTSFVIDNLLITEIAAIPEPGTLLLAVAGLCGIVGRRRPAA